MSHSQHPGNSGPGDRPLNEQPGYGRDDPTQNSTWPGRAVPDGAPGGPGDGYPGGVGAPAKVAGRGMAIASLVLGISALVIAAAPFVPVVIAVIGCVLGVLALVRLRARPDGGRGQGRGMAIAGIATSALGVVAGIVVSIFWVAVVSVAGPQLGHVMECFRTSDPTQQQICMERVLREYEDSDQSDRGGEQEATQI